jgi:hypothetical protein
MPQQIGLPQLVQHILPVELTQASSGRAKTATATNMARWLNENPFQEHWNAVARMSVMSSGSGQAKSKM